MTGRIHLDDMTTDDLERLYERLERAEAKAAAARAALPAVCRALVHLPAVCRYHGERLDPDHLDWGGEACCDTGAPARRRRLAEEAVQRLTAALDVPVDNRPDTSADTADACGGVVQTGALYGESLDCGLLPTRADAVRTSKDTDTADNGQGVRIEYRATVPRHMLGAAVIEALGVIARETKTPTAADPPASPASDPPGHE